jgi:hypothetical protein
MLYGGASDSDNIVASRTTTTQHTSEDIMKRILFALALILTVATFASAQNAPAPGGSQAAPAAGASFVDANGDGICDLYQAGGNGTQRGQRAGKGYGPGNGSGNMGAGPKDGTGFGPGTGVCTGTCTGTGAQTMRRGRRQ